MENLKVISQNTQFTKLEATLEPEMNPDHDENATKRVTQNGKAKSVKSQLVARIARLVRAAGLDYEGWRYVVRRIRQKCQLTAPKKPKKLPRVLNPDEFRKFYKMVDQAEDVQHALMLRLTFYTAVRVSELCGIEVSDVDLENCKVFIDQGKGSKDRYVLFGKSFATALKTHIAAHPENRWLFQTKRHTQFSPRRVQQIVKHYAEQAGVRCTPHTFRHQAITWLTRQSGMADAELQLITGHARRETLAIYQHVALDNELEQKYQKAMKEAGL